MFPFFRIFPREHPRRAGLSLIACFVGAIKIWDNKLGNGEIADCLGFENQA